MERMRNNIVMLVVVGVFVLILSVNSVALEWDWYENFDDPADFGPPAGSPPWPTGGGWTSFFNPLFEAPGGFGGGTYTVEHIDRAGHGKAIITHSTNPELNPFWFGLSNDNAGVRWKFDMLIGDSHTANSLKFFHWGEIGHRIYLRGAGDNAYFTDLSTGERAEPVGTPESPNLYFRARDAITSDTYVGRTNLEQFRGEWITVEFEILCSNFNASRSSAVKIWINGNLDLYLNEGHDGVFYNCWEPPRASRFMIGSYSQSAGGSIYLGLDNFYKYSSQKDTTPECNDEIDNDGDGQTDLADSGCSSSTDGDETDCGDGVCEGSETPASCSSDCGSPLQTCSQMGGSCCSGVEMCTGETLPSSDCSDCCVGGSCETPLETCSQLGGSCCSQGETCSTTTEQSSDCTNCCIGTCETPVQTCAQQGGDICSSSETCPSPWLTASDSDRCCSITCQASSGDEIIVDNQDAGFSTTDGSDPRGWWSSGYANPYAGTSLASDVNQGSTATWTANIDGAYEVYAWWTEGLYRPNDAEYTINHAGGASRVNVNQLQNGGQWNLLGTFTFSGTGSVMLSDSSSDSGAGAVCADAVRFVSTVGCVPTHAADNNPCDNSVSMNELISYINSWIDGDVTLQDVMGAIVVWKDG